MDEIRRSRSFGSWLKRMASPPAPSSRKTSPFPRTVDKTKRPGVYGVPLCESICYARSTVGYVDEEAVKHRRAGIVPLVVAKCGSYLKSQALETEGIFRISGSMKRVNTLQRLFDDPNGSYGLHLNWVGYTVHDAASALRRYLNKMPEPVIPYHMYESFRDVMSDKHHRTTEQKVRAYQQLIQHLPIPHQHLLLYLLDFLSLFASHSSENKMDATNLAIVFAPGILNHPSHTSPVHCRISQRVLEFLIEFQALFTMQLLSLTTRKQRLLQQQQQQQQPKEAPQPRSSPSTPTPTTSPSSYYYQPQLAILSTSDEAQENGDTIPPVPPLPSWLPTPALHPPQPIHATASSSRLSRLASSNANASAISLHAPPRPSRSEPLLHQAAHVSTGYPHERADSGADVHTPTKDTSLTANASPASGASTPRAASPLSQHDTPPPLNQPPLTHPNDVPESQRVPEAPSRSKDSTEKKADTPVAASAVLASLGLIILLVFGYEFYQAAWAMQSLEPYLFLGGFTIYCTLLVHGIAWSNDADPPKGYLGDDEEDDDMDVISLLERNRDLDADDWPVDATSEWRSLLMRQWRDDESVAGSKSNKDTSDQLSILSTVSRFNEEADTGAHHEKSSDKTITTEQDDINDDDDDDDDDDSWIDIDLQEIWRRQQQIQEDQALAQRMQYEENSRAAAAKTHQEQQYGLARTVLPSARPSPAPARSRSTDRPREEWKISSRRQTWTSPPR